jgi:hypothetical protein
MLHGTPRLHGASTPEEIVGDPMGYMRNTALMPGIMFGMAVLALVVLILYGICRSGCKCCCPCNRKRENRQIQTLWKQVLGALVFVLVGAVCLQYAYTTQLSRSAKELVGKAIDAKAYFDEIVAQAHVLDNHVKYDLVLLDRILQSNATTPFYNTTLFSNLEETRSSVSAAANASTDVIKQIDKEYDIQAGVDIANSYIAQGERYGDEVTSAILFFAAAGLITLLPMDRRLAISIRVVVVFFSFGIIVGQIPFSVATYTLTIVMADGCINPTAFLSAQANDSVIDYYLNCDDPLHGGPVNANFDTALASVQVVTAPLQALEQAASMYAPVLYGLTLDLQTNITATVAVMNDTRVLISCTRIHDLLQDVTRRLCSPSEVLGGFFVLSWSHYMSALLVVAVLIWAWNPLHVATHDLVPLNPPARYTDSGGHNYPFPAD